MTSIKTIIPSISNPISGRVPLMMHRRVMGLLVLPVRRLRLRIMRPVPWRVIIIRRRVAVRRLGLSVLTDYIDDRPACSQADISRSRRTAATRGSRATRRLARIAEVQVREQGSSDKPHDSRYAHEFLGHKPGAGRGPPALGVWFAHRLYPFPRFSCRVRLERR